MRRDFAIALLLALAAIPIGAALMAAPLLFSDAARWLLAACFYGGIALAGLLIFAAFIIAIRDERLAERIGQRKRMIPLIGMIVSAVCFLSFAALYFWPTSMPPQVPEYLDGVDILVYPSTIQEIQLAGTTTRACSRLHILAESAFWTGTQWQPQDIPPAVTFSDLYKGQRLTIPITNYSIGTIAFGAPP